MAEQEINYDPAFVDETLRQLGDSLEDGLNSSIVAGEPVTIDKVTLVSLSSVSIGLGSGDGSAEGDGEEMSAVGLDANDIKGYGKGFGIGGGGGGGGSVKPVAVIAFTEQGVQVLKVPRRAGLMDRLIEKDGFLEKVFSKFERR